ncbi:MAG: PAS domain S-box protein, partial [Candidatus Methylomirabilia bacterium]
MKATRPVTLATLRSFRDREGSTGDQPGAPRWLAISVGIAAVTVALVLWQALLVHERADAHRMIEEQASDLRTEMQDLIELRILALVRMAKHWEMERGTPKEEWEADAALYVAHDSSYQAIEWVDPSFHVRWIVPLEGNEAALDLDLAFEERRRVALEVAREQREVTLTRTADLVQGDKGLLAYVPLFPGGDFHGFILGVFRVAKLLDAILAEKIALGYSVAVFDGEEEIYSRYDAQRQHEEEWAQEMEVDIHNVTWRVRMWPRSEWLTKAQSPLPHVVLAVGLVMGVLLTLTVHLAQTAQRRTREVQRANEELEEENTQRTRAEEELRALTGTLEQRVVERTKEVEARRREAESLAEVGQLISQSLDPAEVGQRVVGSVRGLLGIQMSVLYRLDLESEDLVALASSGAAKPSFEWDLTLPRGAGLSGLAVRERQPVATPDILTDPRVEYTPDARSHLGRATYRAALAVPLVVKDRVVGALAVGDRAGRVFTDEEIRLAQTFADQAAVAVENARLYEQARSTRDFLHSITENSADAIITTDIRGRITYFSPGAEEIFGYQAEEILGRPAAEYYRSGPEEARAVMDRLRADTQVRNHEAAFRHKDGRWVETNASISLLRDTSGAIVGVVGVVKDITERKQLEKELIRSERVWAVGEMAAGVAHNFNNLLAVVLGRAQLLLLQLGEKKLQLGDVQRNLVVIERAALNGAATVRRLLEFTRDTPRPGEAVTVDVEELLTHTMELARHRWKDEAEAQGRPIEVVLEPGAVPPAAGTPAELQEVLLSLVLNAIDAMPQGGTLTLSSWA